MADCRLVKEFKGLPLQEYQFRVYGSDIFLCGAEADMKVSIADFKKHFDYEKDEQGRILL